MNNDLAEAERSLRRVLIVVKKTAFQVEVLEQKDPHLLKLLSEGNPSVTRLEATHKEHLSSLALVKDALIGRGLGIETIERDGLNNLSTKFDLVISFGGDGTFLDTSHAVADTPVLGVNSATMSSHGHWCLANRENFGSILDEILAGTRLPLALMRLEVAINGKPLPQLVLNEICLCAPSPAETTRFRMDVGEQSEELRSSGILVGPGAGSTGWIHSAGGTVLPATSQQFQFLLREPCVWPGEERKLLRGILERSDKVKLVPLMPAAKIFIDGQHTSYDIKRGDEVVVSASSQDLRAYLSPDANESYKTN